ncbi:hypothetical protein OG689_42705 [Kitasatospora sp. NBC_00240]|uniref:hypothetical protein n=1 Tax=Kitasatospora sp. NBC_00240 TaxID=2903567 RepID=UPI00225506E3|nr:hypothetical protein [Kitasatospora sp. NBC_00240]MCX5215860.1 hypothetical protein [Kitasatospora sp. NBC_00240]
MLFWRYERERHAGDRLRVGGVVGGLHGGRPAGRYEPGPTDRAGLDFGPGWKRRWTTTWCLDGAGLVCPVAELGGVPVGRTRPVRGFSWHPRQGHRPGLELLVSTGRLHGFESLEEHRFLRAADFAGPVRDVLSQPFRLRYWASGRTRTHIPDYLVVTWGGRWLVDVRPLHLVKDADRPGFAAAAELARAVGWQYSVVAGWRPHVSGAVEAMRAEARPMSHLLDLQERMVSVLAGGAMPFGDLVRVTPYPVMARAHALHLLAPADRRGPGRTAGGRLARRADGRCTAVNGHVEVGPGAVLRLENGEWTVRDVLPASGEVVLVSADGGVRVWTLGLLAGKVRTTSGRTVAREDLSDDQLVLLRAACPAPGFPDGVTACRRTVGPDDEPQEEGAEVTCKACIREMV